MTSKIQENNDFGNFLSGISISAVILLIILALSIGI